MFEAIKRWFRNSGIRYVLAEGRPELQGQDMNDLQNPLDVVVENPNQPFARIYRTHFWNGLEDTLEVLIGNHYDLNLRGYGSKGLFDILIFPLLARRLLAQSYYPEVNFFLAFVYFVTGVFLEIPRLAFGVVGTLIASPIVMLVHMLTFFKAQKLKKQAGEVNIKAGKSAKEIVAELREPQPGNHIQETKNLTKEEVKELGLQSFIPGLAEDQPVAVTYSKEVKPESEAPIALKSKKLSEWLQENSPQLSCDITDIEYSSQDKNYLIPLWFYRSYGYFSSYRRRNADFAFEYENPLIAKDFVNPDKAVADTVTEADKAFYELNIGGRRRI